MTGRDLFEGMSWVDERFVDEAENAILPEPKVVPWIRIASVAACLCLILAGMHHMLPYWNPESMDVSDGQENLAQGSIGEELKDEAVQSVIETPDNNASLEVPSVILYVDGMTGLGFTGRVTRLVDTDIFEIGMELNVVVADGTRHEDSPAMHDNSKTDYSGCYVMVQFIEYDRETGTIVVNMITEVPAEKG